MSVYCNTCGHEKICGCNQWQDPEKEELEKKLAIAFDELQGIATGMRHGKERECALKALQQLSE